MIYNLLFTNHTIDLTSEYNQSPILQINQSHQELRAEIHTWLKQEWITKQQERQTNCPKIYGPFNSTTLFTCDLTMPNAKAMLDELALDTHPGFPAEGVEERRYENVKHLRLDARGIKIQEFDDLEIDMHNFFTNPVVEIIFSNVVGEALRKWEHSIEMEGRPSTDWCTACHFLFKHRAGFHLRKDCTCFVLQPSFEPMAAGEHLIKVLEVEGENSF
jgi:hypothetical protein